MIRLRDWITRLAGCVMALGFATAHAADPPAPPGRDPGGAMVALVAGGFDYTRPDIAARLARDGEGEIVGFDFVDGDRAPFDGAANGEGTAAARTVALEAPGARLALLRAAAADIRSVGRSLSFVGKSPARVAVVALMGVGDDVRKVVEQAARWFTDILFVVAVEAERKPGIAADPSAPPVPDNVLVVAGTGDREAGDGTGVGERGAAPVPVPSGSAILTAATLAATAARLAEAEPSLTGAEMKQRLAAEPPRRE